MADPPGSAALLREGIAAAQAGQAARARDCLMSVVQADEHNLQAWYWLSQVVESPQEREICLENVLALDPGHTAVQSELAALRAQMAQAQRATSVAALIPETPEEILVSDAAVEPLPCPYCGADAGPQEGQCPTCQRPLYVRERKTKGHSFYSLGLVMAWFVLANYVWLGLAFYYFGSSLSSTLNASPRAAAALETVTGLIGLQAPSVGVGVLSLPLFPVLLGGAAIFLFSLVVAMGLYLRLRSFYWLTVGLTIAGSLLLLYNAFGVEFRPLFQVAAALIFCIAATSFAFMAYDEFAWVDRRLAAVLDPDVDSHSAVYTRGRKYAGQGMWARAAVHWAKAVALSPGHADYRLALASAYINLDQPQRALEHLQAAQQIEPDNPQLPDLLRQVRETA